MSINQINTIFRDECSYDNINAIRDTNMRYRKNGINLADAFVYKMMYTKKDSKKRAITAELNKKYTKNFKRQAFDQKEANIPVKIYQNILDRMADYCNINCTDHSGPKLIGVDGTYNNGRDHKDNLNMGFFDITNSVPVDVTSCGNKNKNGEVTCCRDYIMQHLDEFKNNILVGDRAYFAYNLMDFLGDNTIKYILRAKGDAANLDLANTPTKNTGKYDTIMKIRPTVRVIKFEENMNKTVYGGEGKKNRKKYNLVVKNKCVLITNLLDTNKYPDNTIMNMYRSRWDIEVFFKHLKNNFKFQHIRETDQKNVDKMYLCMLIIVYLAKMLFDYYVKHQKTQKVMQEEGKTIKVNYVHLIDGVFTLLPKLVRGKLTSAILNKFCGQYIQLVKNNTGRSFPRESKTPFTKWYVKAYSGIAKNEKLIQAIQNGTVDTLHKNLKTLAAQIVSINGKKYGSTK